MGCIELDNSFIQNDEKRGRFYFWALRYLWALNQFFFLSLGLRFIQIKKPLEPQAEHSPALTLLIRRLPLLPSPQLFQSTNSTLLLKRRSPTCSLRLDC